MRSPANGSSRASTRSRRDGSSRRDMKAPMRRPRSIDKPAPTLRMTEFTGGFRASTDFTIRTAVVRRKTYFGSVDDLASRRLARLGSPLAVKSTAEIAELAENTFPKTLD